MTEYRVKDGWSGRVRVIHAETRDEAALQFIRHALGHEPIEHHHEGAGWYGFTHDYHGMPVPVAHQFRVYKPPNQEGRGVVEGDSVTGVAEWLYRNGTVSGLGWAVRELGIGSATAPAGEASGRADLALIPDHGPSIGVEVKTRRDSLTRLPRQVRLYQTNFALKYLACTPNHHPGADLILPREWGILILDGSGAVLDQIRPATPSPDPFSARAVLHELWADEVRAELRRLKVQFHPRTPAYRLTGMLWDALGQDPRPYLARLAQRRRGARVQCWRVGE